MKPYETLTHRGQILRLRRLALKALAHYELADFRLTPLQHGENTTFRVDLSTGERYSLRIHRLVDRSVAAVQSELEWLTALRRDDFVVPEPVPTRDGQLLTVTQVEGVPTARISVLFCWVEGRFVHGKVTANHLSLVGALMARLHHHAITFKMSDAFVRERVDSLTEEVRNQALRGVSAQVARQPIEHPDDEAAAIRIVTEVTSPADGELVARLMAEVHAARRAVGQGPESFGLIHADLHEDNFLFAQGHMRAIDFDDCGFGYFLYDIATTLNEVNWREDAPVLRASLLAGYRSVRHLSAEHERYLDTFIALRDLQMVLLIIHLRDHPRFQDRWERHIKRKLQAIKNFLERSKI